MLQSCSVTASVYYATMSSQKVFIFYFEYFHNSILVRMSQKIEFLSPSRLTCWGWCEKTVLALNTWISISQKQGQWQCRVNSEVFTNHHLFPADIEWKDGACSNPIIFFHKSLLQIYTQRCLQYSLYFFAVLLTAVQCISYRKIVIPGIF